MLCIALRLLNKQFNVQCFNISISLDLTHTPGGSARTDEPLPSYSEATGYGVDLNTEVVQPELPHAPLPVYGAHSNNSFVDDENTKTSKWSSPRSAFSIESFRVPQRDLGTPGEVFEVRTSRQLSTLPDEKPPNSFMVLSALTIFCCLLLGIVAIIKSVEVMNAVSASKCFSFCPEIDCCSPTFAFCYLLGLE